MCDCISWHAALSDVGWTLETLGTSEAYSRIVEEESGGVSPGRSIPKVLMKNFMYLCMYNILHIYNESVSFSSLFDLKKNTKS